LIVAVKINMACLFVMTNVSMQRRIEVPELPAEILEVAKYGIVETLKKIQRRAVTILGPKGACRGKRHLHCHFWGLSGTYLMFPLG